MVVWLSYASPMQTRMADYTIAYECSCGIYTLPGQVYYVVKTYLKFLYGVTAWPTPGTTAKPLMLATQLFSLNFVDTKQCGTAHAQSKTSTRGKKMARVVLVRCI